MAEFRFIEFIRNGTNVNVDSIQPSTIWIPPQSKRNKISFLCLPGGLGKGSNNSIALLMEILFSTLKGHIQHISISDAFGTMILVDHQVVYGREYTLDFQSNLYFLIENH